MLWVYLVKENHYEFEEVQECGKGFKKESAGVVGFCITGTVSW